MNKYIGKLPYALKGDPRERERVRGMCTPSIHISLFCTTQNERHVDVVLLNRGLPQSVTISG